MSMKSTWMQIRRYVKRGLAGVLFSLLVLGASAAALSMVAAGIRALSGPAALPAEPVTASTAAPSVAAGGYPAPLPGQAGSLPLATSAGEQGTLDAWDHRLVGMQSPIANTLDRGGVILGLHVQEAFGRLLSGLLETLFLERPAVSGGGQP
ncbi:MAG: hypothetical protein K6T81_05650 [Alicyclobacillus macrosporangiidus]|uniref:hypothetical protein n=1 Tax=Alicyclobacillus macrosporangiidus TaxID=392015 RepID=UPI0026EC6C37|nr:hypothetical protein [Alicyclobacillus macrosporangiidus]MCL6598209.1 hypothetical protein [Alicyclobacillus macrosporangiidus]